MRDENATAQAVTTRQVEKTGVLMLIGGAAVG
jgi:hypothetical protein